MVEKFYIRRWNMSKKDNLVVIYCTLEELLLNMAFGEIRYAEDAEGYEVEPLD
jgi:hypothetical protein